MKTITLKGRQTYIQVDYPEFSLIPIQTATTDVVKGCEILLHLREVEPEEKRVSFVHWVFERLKEKYRDAWPDLWENYLTSPEAGRLIAEFEINEIVGDSDFGEE